MRENQGRILVVDDYAMNRLETVPIFAAAGAYCDPGGTWRQAVELIHEGSFDLMLLDIEMPEMDGYEVLDYMKQHDLLRNLPAL